MFSGQCMYKLQIDLIPLSNHWVNVGSVQDGVNMWFSFIGERVHGLLYSKMLSKLSPNLFELWTIVFEVKLLQTRGGGLLKSLNLGGIGMMRVLIAPNLPFLCLIYLRTSGLVFERCMPSSRKGNLAGPGLLSALVSGSYWYNWIYSPYEGNNDFI